MPLLLENPIIKKKQLFVDRITEYNQPIKLKYNLMFLKPPVPIGLTTYI
jgi:hypothetical protein